MSQFEVPVDLHKELNPKIWENNQVKTPVNIALLKIAKEYYDFLGINVPIVDVVVSGSQANYNYSEHSDLDLHLIVPYSKVQCDMAVDQLFDTKRKLWKEQHTLNIYGIPVELYAEDVETPAVSSTYSLLKQKWIKPPATPEVNFDEDEIARISLIWIRVITGALKTQDLEQCQQVKELLWKYRKVGLAKDGEMGTPNLVFKALRNSDITKLLLDAVRHLEDQSLSI